jgi:hypothetical protein
LVLVVSNRNKFTTLSLFAKSVFIPVLNSELKFLHICKYLAFSLLSISSNQDKILLTRIVFILLTTGLACVNSRDTFNGKSSVSTTPFTNRKYSGKSSFASSCMKTRLTYNCNDLSPASLNNADGADDGKNNIALKLTLPSIANTKCDKGF